MPPSCVAERMSNCRSCFWVQIQAHYRSILRSRAALSVSCSSKVPLTCLSALISPISLTLRIEMAANHASHTSALREPSPAPTYHSNVGSPPKYGSIEPPPPGYYASELAQRTAPVIHLIVLGAVNYVSVRNYRQRGYNIGQQRQSVKGRSMPCWLGCLLCFLLVAILVLIVWSTVRRHALEGS